mgnify:CR=1 FL=1
MHTHWLVLMIAIKKLDKNSRCHHLFRFNSSDDNIISMKFIQIFRSKVLTIYYNISVPLQTLILFLNCLIQWMQIHSIDNSKISYIFLGKLLIYLCSCTRSIQGLCWIPQRKPQKIVEGLFSSVNLLLFLHFTQSSILLYISLLWWRLKI